MSKTYKNKNRGFTLIELMVATSIFSMVMLASLGALFTLLGASKDSRATHTAMDNVNFALESMTRSIRMGSKYYCEPGGILLEDIGEGKDCPNGGTAISFLPQGEESKTVDYVLKVDGSRGTIQRCVATKGCVQVISDAVNVTDLKFYVTGVEDSKKQPGVFVKLEGEVTVKEKDIPFLIQTFINQRNY